MTSFKLSLNISIWSIRRKNIWFWIPLKSFTYKFHRFLVMPPSLRQWRHAQHNASCNPLIISTECATATYMLPRIGKAQKNLIDILEQWPSLGTISQASMTYHRQKIMDWRQCKYSSSSMGTSNDLVWKSTTNDVWKESKVVCSLDKCHTWGKLYALPTSTPSERNLLIKIL